MDKVKEEDEGGGLNCLITEWHIELPTSLGIISFRMIKLDLLLFSLLACFCISRTWNTYLD